MLMLRYAAALRFATADARAAALRFMLCCVLMLLTLFVDALC